MTKQTDMEERIIRLESIVDQLDAGLIATSKALYELEQKLYLHAHDMLAMKTYSPHGIDWTGTALWHD